ncbi:hypothetical protein SAMCCGM7_pC0759 (plasmid) [Sinorhizobium americanum CCGM7]|nr:hypothetical protein SAMCCGM7_pC0759 [Sinorhizobium americanum CCGM7]
MGDSALCQQYRPHLRLSPVQIVMAKRDAPDPARIVLTARVQEGRS